ncbi:MAG: hypothetical protein IAE77_03790 [Prosthecobacter sp.]|jgi:hypothetical protein|uniref:hypothetical protein n=1 Tax=Prosthecobacter sp. TaxID=1965333 RepID=UPI001A082F0C|nr:hypothetical protein [Prosthecobacter sp.]MBE2282567.1 hypothetical protein [Prosthecobacter sp.]
MKSAPTFIAAALISALLASCASSTMDSVPTLAELTSYERVIRARYQGEYDDLERQRSKGGLSQEDYVENKRRLDSKVAEEVNDAAWQKHFLAESERKADGVPTPDAPVALNPGSGSGGFYQPMTKQNFGNAIGMSGTAGMGSMRAANEQITSGQMIRQDAMSAGGTYLSKPPPGSIYDEDEVRR